MGIVHVGPKDSLTRIGQLYNGGHRLLLRSMENPHSSKYMSLDIALFLDNS